MKAMIDLFITLFTVSPYKYLTWCIFACAVFFVAWYIHHMNQEVRIPDEQGNK